jgi:hypothetical protein
VANACRADIYFYRGVQGVSGTVVILHPEAWERIICIREFASICAECWAELWLLKGSGTNEKRQMTALAIAQYCLLSFQESKQEERDTKYIREIAFKTHRK